MIYSPSVWGDPTFYVQLYTSEHTLPTTTRWTSWPEAVSSIPYSAVSAVSPSFLSQTPALEILAVEIAGVDHADTIWKRRLLLQSENLNTLFCPDPSVGKLRIALVSLWCKPLVILTDNAFKMFQNDRSLTVQSASDNICIFFLCILCSIVYKFKPCVVS